MGLGTSKRTGRRRARKAPRPALHPAESGNEVESALAALAHDIRTPLTGVLALSELLAAADLPERERGWARAIQRAAEHLSVTTSIVLDAVKADVTGLVLHQEPFSPRELAQDIAESLQARTAVSGLSADVSIAQEVPDRAIGDVVRLRAALENLIDNAVKFTARGQVSLHVTARPAAGDKMQLSFAVGDSGIGMTEAEIALLFKPFVQANPDIARRFGGIGLGLVLVKRLAEAMGGDLTVVSAPGQGSTFTLTVMVAQK